jgi:hypothetical protein
MLMRTASLLPAAIVATVLACGAALAAEQDHSLSARPFIGPVRMSSGGVPLVRRPGRGVSLHQPLLGQSALALGATNGARDGNPELRLTLSLQYSF